MGTIYAITQTTDGYLWIGAEAGLIRFDGLDFKMVQAPDSSGLSVRHVLGLIPDLDGGLWLRLSGPTLVHYQNGAFSAVSPSRRSAESMVTAMVLSRDRRLLISSRLYGVAALGGSKFEPIATEADLPRAPVVSIAQTANGDYWLGTLDGGLIRLQGQRASTVSMGAKEPEIKCLLPDEIGQLWIGTDRGLFKWNGKAVVQFALPAEWEHQSVLSLARDRDSNIWVGTAKRGLIRITADGISHFEEPGPSLAVTAVFEDREGNIWTGADSGIDRLRDGAFVTYAESAGLPSEGNGSVYAGPGETIWWAPGSGGLCSLNQGKANCIKQAGLDREVVYSISGRDGELWVGRQHGGLTHLHWPQGSLQTETYTRKDGLAQNTVYVAEENKDGSVWAGTVNGGASLFRDGKFSNYSSSDGMAVNTVTSILESSSGTAWFAGPGGLSSLTRGTWKVYRTTDGLPSLGVNCLLEDSAGILWIGTMNGLAFFRSGRLSVPPRLPASLRTRIFGIADDRRGSLWIAFAEQIVRVDRERLLAGTLTEGDVREYGLQDGVASVSTARRHRSLVTDARGRIWLSMNHGLSMIDPARLAADSAPTIVHIEGMSVAGESIDLSSDVHLKAGVRRLTIRYAGVNLSAPDRVRFRFILEGNDHDWSEPVQAREAVYTNLKPGPYRFRVMASNADRVWNGVNATIAFEVEPAFWQTWWFRLAALLTILLVISALYRLRLDGMRKQFNMRFEERLAERTRIARDLHDTLLQTIQGSKLLVDGALAESKRDPATYAARHNVLEKLSGWLEQAANEGRTAVNSLRVSTTRVNDLADAFRQVAAEYLIDDSMKVTVSTEGTARDLHPIAREEIFHIGYEAIRNACRHSGCTRLEVELNYGRDFALRVLDNGRGIHPDVATHGKPGHFGLQGMQERATQVGGKLSLFSSTNSGTEIELIVPGNVVFSVE